MLNLIFATSLAFTAQGTELPQLNLAQQTSLRCSAAFALVQRDRNGGTDKHPDYPEMEERGKEFFIRTGIQLMEETGIGEAQYEELIFAEIDSLSAPQKLAEIMPGCLLLLDASGI